MYRRSFVPFAVVLTLLAAAGSSTAAAHKAKPKKHPKPLAARQKLARIKHFVVIYQENHSFDNLYGSWEGVNGLANAPAARTTQVNQQGVPFACLRQTDVNLTTPPQPTDCTDTTTGTSFTSHFRNAPFPIETFLPASAATCPAPGVFAANGVLNGQGLPGGCTRDLVHRFYQEQYQLNGGAQNRYVTGSDAVGLVMGVYATKSLPIYRYLHAARHPRYVIADSFFQAAFGGSFLNHQWLAAAATPVWPGAPNDAGANDLHSVVDANRMPTSYPLYTSPLGTNVRDQSLTASCTPPAGRPATPAGVACGDFAVNTTQPQFQPYAPGTASTRLLPAQTAPTIGDRLSAKKLSWAWYAGGWSNANGDVGGPGWTNGGGPTCSDPDTAANATYPNCPDKLFQYHHQPFNYFQSFAPGTAARKAHLRDEAEFLQLARGSTKACRLPAVSFVKPVGAENEHPGYASEGAGSSHLVALLRAVEGSRCAKDTMVIATYDEFGGQWDHVPVPGMGTAGPHDKWGPGTRIPALILSPMLSNAFAVDHVSHDTTSILATIEHRYRLAALSSRDRAVKDLSSVFTAKKAK